MSGLTKKTTWALCYFCIFSVLSLSDHRDYALKLIEGTGISMSACREIAVSLMMNFAMSRDLSGCCSCYVNSSIAT